MRELFKAVFCKGLKIKRVIQIMIVIEKKKSLNQDILFLTIILFEQPKIVCIFYQNTFENIDEFFHFSKINC